MFHVSLVLGIHLQSAWHAPGEPQNLSGAIQRALHRAGGGSCSKLQLCIRQRGADSNPKRSLHLPVVGSHIQKTLTKNKGYLGSVITESLEAMLFLSLPHTQSNVSFRENLQTLGDIMASRKLTQGLAPAVASSWFLHKSFQQAGPAQVPVQAA